MRWGLAPNIFVYSCQQEGHFLRLMAPLLSNISWDDDENVYTAVSPHNSPPNLIDIVSQTLNKACKGQAGIRVSEQLSSYTSSSTLYPCRSIDRVLSVATGFASLLEKAKCVKLIQYAKSNNCIVHVGWLWFLPHSVLYFLNIYVDLLEVEMVTNSPL